MMKFRSESCVYQKAASTRRLKARKLRRTRDGQKSDDDEDEFEDDYDRWWKG
jgi:hypothetical protein